MTHSLSRISRVLRPARPAPRRSRSRSLLDSLATFATFALSLALGLAAALSLGCSSKRIEAAPERSSASDPPMSSEPATPAAQLTPVAPDRLCVTKGTAAIGRPVTEPTMRAVALGSSGDAAALSFTFRGDTATTRELGSGESRRQLGLKLRAQDGCNLLYVMWRLDPKPSLSVSLKHNPGKRTHKECGTSGYTRLKPPRALASSLSPVPALVPGASHTLRAELISDELLAWIDDQLVWRGPLPPAARTLNGPAGLRSDNVRFDLVSFSAGAAPPPSSPPKCSSDASD